jgi:DNA-binding response OmpR family regulator
LKTLLVGVGAGSAVVAAEVLGARGHGQLVAETGVRALEVIERESPELVVVEDPLVDMTATEFCRRARTCQEGADSVILVITTRVFTADDG